MAIQLTPTNRSDYSSINCFVRGDYQHLHRARSLGVQDESEGFNDQARRPSLVAADGGNGTFWIRADQPSAEGGAAMSAVLGFELARNMKKRLKLPTI